MKFHVIKEVVRNATGLTTFDEDNGVSVLVTGDKSEMVEVIKQNLEQLGCKFTIERGHKFKGAKFVIALVNKGTTFNADWEFVNAA